jgi:hypothetical protein
MKNIFNKKTLKNVLYTVLCICKKVVLKRTYYYIDIENFYGYPEVCKIECFLLVIPYKTTPIEAHHNIQSAKRHLKGIRNKEPFYCE